MASSRRSASSVERALAALAPARLVVAFSGGLDSTVLLHAAARVLGADRIVAAHVHHGLQAAADAWPAHCAREARALGVAYRCLRLAPAPASGANLEAWAREQRYRALARLARRVGAVAILTAHHADDQVETMLMRLARGTGIDGLSGIAARATLGGATVIRPLLDLPRACLAEHARIYGLRWIEDPSNRDLGRTRNAIRHRVLPALEAAVPGLSAALLAALPRIRAARDAQDASAQQDLARARSGAGLDRRALAGLSLERRHAALRAWLRSQGLRMPGVARLREIDRQLIGAEGACGRVLHDGVALLRYRNDLVACKASSLDAPPPTRVELQWRGEPAIDLPGDAGRLLVEPVRATTMAGVDPDWLRAQPLALAPGGASSLRLRPGPDARRRTLKNLYQERGVPGWLRPSLPLVFAGGRLLYASALGMDHDPARAGAGSRVALRWLPARRDDPRARWCPPT